MRQNWAAQELSGIDPGDARLNKRSVVLLDRLTDKPTSSIPTACNGWAEPIEDALRRCHNNKSTAAQFFGLTLRQPNYRTTVLNISLPERMP